jgi:hypothetical protein
MKQRVRSREVRTSGFDRKAKVAGYSMTSSASASIVGGMLRPIALAVASVDKDVAFRQQFQ